MFVDDFFVRFVGAWASTGFVVVFCFCICRHFARLFLNQTWVKQRAKWASSWAIVKSNLKPICHLIPLSASLKSQPREIYGCLLLHSGVSYDLSRFQLVTLNKLQFLFWLCFLCVRLIEITKPYLNSRLRKVDFQRDFLAHKNIRISCLVEQRLEKVQLSARVGGALPPLLSAVSCTKRGKIFI